MLFQRIKEMRERVKHAEKSLSSVQNGSSSLNIEAEDDELDFELDDEDDFEAELAGGGQMSSEELARQASSASNDKHQRVEQLTSLNECRDSDMAVSAGKVAGGRPNQPEAKKDASSTAAAAASASKSPKTTKCGQCAIQ